MRAPPWSKSLTSLVSSLDPGREGWPFSMNTGQESGERGEGNNAEHGTFPFAVEHWLREASMSFPILSSPLSMHIFRCPNVLTKSLDCPLPYKCDSDARVIMT